MKYYKGTYLLMIIFVTFHDEMNENYVIILDIARCWMKHSFTVSALYWALICSLVAQPLQSRWIVRNNYYQLPVLILMEQWTCSIANASYLNWNWLHFIEVLYIIIERHCAWCVAVPYYLLLLARLPG